MTYRIIYGKTKNSLSFSNRDRSDKFFKLLKFVFFCFYIVISDKGLELKAQQFFRKLSF